MERRFLVVCNAPGYQTELSGLDLGEYDVCAVNRAGLELPSFRYWATLHAEDMVEWIRESGKTGFIPVLDYPFHLIHNAYIPSFTVGLTGSSSLFAVIAGICLGYHKIRIVGAPLTDEKYVVYRRGWANMEPYLRGRQIESSSGWTKAFLEKSCKPID